MYPAFLSEGLVSSEDELVEIIGNVEREWDDDYALDSSFIYLEHLCRIIIHSWFAGKRISSLEYYSLETKFNKNFKPGRLRAMST